MNIPDFDRSKFHLGKLCKRGHEWGDSKRTLKRIDNNCCPLCQQACDKIRRPLKPKVKLTDKERFWPKVQKTETCWLWTASANEQGYGRMTVNGKGVAAHRYSYELAYGPIPDGLNVLHRCDRPACVRPDHLFVGTQADNVVDMVTKGRQRCPKGEEHYWRKHPEFFLLKGQNNPHAKLTDEQVLEIRRRYAEGGVTQVQLGKEYGVRQTLITEPLPTHRMRGVRAD